MILLDMLMPIVDGWKFLAEMRRRSLTIPVILTTGTNLTREWADDHSCGFVHKPIDLPLLLTEIERFIG